MTIVMIYTELFVILEVRCMKIWQVPHTKRWELLDSFFEILIYIGYYYITILYSC